MPGPRRHCSACLPSRRPCGACSRSGCTGRFFGSICSTASRLSSVSRLATIAIVIARRQTSGFSKCVSSGQLNALSNAANEASDGSDAHLITLHLDSGEQARDYEHRGNFAIEADLEEVGRPRSQSLLYRAARELLANARKHARASTVQVRLAHTADAITLGVVDDGIGFDPAILDRCVAEGHIGLASLAVRIDAMGGSMKLTSMIGAGTRASVTTPAGAD